MSKRRNTDTTEAIKKILKDANGTGKPRSEDTQSEDELIPNGIPDGKGDGGLDRNAGMLTCDYEQRVRPLIDLIDRLRRIGLDQDVGLPSIVVVGDQSAGKSSVLEAISGVQLPRGSGIVTRCPLELRLKRTPGKWRGTIRYKTSKTRGTQVEEELQSKDVIGEKVREAQNKLVGNDTGVSTDLISLDVEGPNLPDLTLIDLPGIVRVVSQDQPKDMADKIRKMIKNYIKKPETIVLAVIPANVDIETSEALQLAQEVDEDHKRTLGVITKTDMIDKGTEDQLISVLLNQRYYLKKGYIAVKCRGQKDIKENQTLEQALQAEQRFFEEQDHFSEIEKDRYSIPSLSARLTDELVENVQRVLPDLKDKIFEKRNKTKEQLDKMGEGVPDDKLGKCRVFLKISGAYCDELKKLVDSKEKYLSSDDERLYPRARDAAATFANRIKAIVDAKEKDPKFREKIGKALEQDRGRELPHFIQYETFCDLTNRIIEEFIGPANECLNQVQSLMNQKLTRLAAASFSSFPALESKIKVLNSAVLHEHTEAGKKRIEELFTMEQMIFSQDEFYNNRLDTIIKKQCEVEQRNDQMQGLYPHTQHAVATPAKRTNIGYLDIGQDKAKERDTMVTKIKAYMMIAVTRIADYIPMIIMQKLIMNVVSALTERVMTLHVEKDSKVLGLLTEDRAAVIRRRDFKASLARLEVATDELLNFNPLTV